MNLFLVGNFVKYNDKIWKISSFGTDGSGNTTVNLVRGALRVTVLDSEIEPYQGG